MPVMKTADLGVSNLEARPAGAGAAVVSPRGTAADGVTADGLRWQVSSAFGATLRRVSATFWQNPADQAWQVIKRNPVRTVYRAEIAGRSYFLKYYFQRGWRHQLKAWLRPGGCRAEWRSALFARAHEIPAVVPVAACFELTVEGRPAALLITEAAEPAENLSDFWKVLQTDEQPRRRRADMHALIEHLAALIARAHQAGLEHTDLHAENVLVQRIARQQYKPLLVDLQGARIGVPVPDRAVVRNLAQLNQWFRRHASLAHRLRFLRSYLRYREELEYRLPHARPLTLDFRSLVKAIEREAIRHAARLARQRDRRAMRSGRYFTKVRLPGGWRGMAYRGSKRDLDYSPASRFQLPRQWWEKQLRKTSLLNNGHAYKESHSADVRRVVFPVDAETQLAAVFKRPRPRNWRRRLRMWLGVSRSRRGWQTAHRLLNRHLPTPRPLAFMERRKWGVVQDSFLLTELVDGAIDLEAFLKREHVARARRGWHRLKRELVALVASRLRDLHAAGIRHRDCKASNLLIVDDERCDLLWTDLDGLQLVGTVRREHVDRALVRLGVSVAACPGITRTDQVRFLKAFERAFGLPPTAWRETLRRLVPLAADKHRALERRRAWKRKKYGRS